MPEATVNHQGGRVVRRVGRLDGFRVPRHAVLDGGALVAIGGDCKENVPFRQDPNEALAVENDRRADPALSHLCRRLAEAESALDREHPLGHDIGEWVHA